MTWLDVVDKLQGVYKCQVHTHKWWHHLFSPHTITCNSWIMRMALCNQLDPTKALNHLDFITKLATCYHLTKVFSHVQLSKTRVSIGSKGWKLERCVYVRYGATQCVLYVEGNITIWANVTYWHLGARVWGEGFDLFLFLSFSFSSKCNVYFDFRGWCVWLRGFQCTKEHIVGILYAKATRVWSCICRWPQTNTHIPSPTLGPN